jgi:hypothetical protein
LRGDNAAFGDHGRFADLLGVAEKVTHDVAFTDELYSRDDPADPKTSNANLPKNIGFVLQKFALTQCLLLPCLSLCLFEAHPPPFSSMNSTPAASKARRAARSLAAVIAVSM